MPARKSKRTPRAVRTDYWRRQVADPTEAVAKLNEAKGRLTLAGIGGNVHTEIIDRFQAEVDTAQAEVDKCFEKIRLHALPGAKFEELVGEHPPVDGVDDEDASYHEETFLPALLAASADNGWAEDDWVEEIAELSVGEYAELHRIVTHVNTRSWSSQIPKD